MVMQDKRCEIRAIPAASVVSPPQEPGITTVLSPRGMAREARIQIDSSLEIGEKSFENAKITPMAIRGITINLIKLSMYMGIVLKVFLRSILATVIPVRSMAMGDIQLPRVETAVSKKAGRGSSVSPSIIPINIPISIGFITDFNFVKITDRIFLLSGLSFSCFGIRSAGIIKAYTRREKGRVNKR